MSTLTNHEKSLTLANYAGVEPYEGEHMYNGPCWINPYDGVLCDNFYNSMSFAWYVHLQAVKEYEAYREWWIAHALDGGENAHHNWLDKIYAVITKRPVYVIDGVPTRGKLPNGVGVNHITDSSLRPSGREVICINTKGIEA